MNRSVVVRKLFRFSEATQYRKDAATYHFYNSLKKQLMCVCAEVLEFGCAASNFTDVLFKVRFDKFSPNIQPYTQRCHRL